MGVFIGKDFFLNFHFDQIVHSNNITMYIPREITVVNVVYIKKTPKTWKSSKT